MPVRPSVPLASGDRAIRAREAAAKLSIATSTFWKWVASGRLPKGRKLSPRTRVWLESEINAVLANAASADADG